MAGRPGALRRRKKRVSGTDTPQSDPIGASDDVIAPIGHAEMLEGRKLLAIAHLMQGRSFKEAAREAGIPERTLVWWAREDEDFIKEYRQQAEAVRDHLVAGVKATALKAVEVVNKALSSKSEARRLAAARLALSTTAAIVRNADQDQAPPAIPMFALPPGTRVGIAVPDVAPITLPATTVIDERLPQLTEGSNTPADTSADASLPQDRRAVNE